MILGIDASNIRAGGGITHLVGLLSSIHPHAYGFKKVVVWSGKNTLQHLPRHEWLEFQHDPLIDKSLLFRVFWQKFRLSDIAKRECDVLLIPGGSYSGSFQPYVVMMQNLLPFDWNEMKRYGFSLIFFKLLLLKQIQSKTLKHAGGRIYLSDYSKNRMQQHVDNKPFKIIAHGVHPHFQSKPKLQKNSHEYHFQNPFRILYVSIVDVYKHQWHVIEAVAMLRKQGVPVVLDLVGTHYKPALKLMMKYIQQFDPHQEFVNYNGYCHHQELPGVYAQSDLFVFASSCETFSFILLEAMASGLPIACANQSAMPEILKHAGVYFNPEDPASIATAINTLFLDRDLRATCSILAYEQAQQYSWKRCADETFAFLKEIANFKKGKRQ